MVHQSTDAATRSDLVEAAGFTYLHVSPDGQLLHADAELARILGVPAHEALIGRDLSCGAPALAQPWVEFCRRLPATGTPATMESVWTRADGTHCRVRQTVRVLCNNSKFGTMIECLAQELDVPSVFGTTLAGPPGAYARLVDNLSDALMLDDVNGRVVFANRAFLDMFGLAPIDVASLCLENYVAPEYRAVLRDRHDRRIRGESVPSRFEYVGRRKDGTPLDLEVSVTSVIENGACIGTQSVIRDVGERKRMERAVRNANQLLAKLIESMPLAVTGLDARRHVTLWNRAAERMFGWTAAEVLGQQYPLVSTESEQAEHLRLWEEAMGGKATEGLETRRRTKDGRLVDVCLWAAPLFDVDGQLVCSIGVLADVSAMKRAERELRELNETLERRVEERSRAVIEAREELRQAQKMDAIGRLAAGIAHDFNNLLTAITGFCGLGMLELPEGHPGRTCVEKADGAARRGAGLVRGLLSFARKDVAIARVMHLNDELAGLRDMLQRLIRANVELEWRLGDGLPNVRVDPTQLEQAVVNLVVNARDAMPQGGRLTITNAVRPPREPGGCPLVTIEVADTGVGMSEDVRSHLFEPFFTTKPRGKGTGLGLATTYSIVAQHGGTIEVSSQVGQGTTFRIVLPTVPDQLPVDVALPDPAATLPPRARARVLLVDTEEWVRDMTRGALQSAGHVVLDARNGAEALRLVTQDPHGIDLVIAEAVMPELGGLELSQRLEVARPDLPVLITSTQVDEDLQRDLRERGLPFLSKPFDLDALYRTVRELLSRPLSGR